MARGNTPQRILAASLTMFNEEGVAEVSTNHIADEVDISPGNLYYHFRNKEQIIERLFDDFEAKFYDTLTVPNETPDIEQIWLFLHLMFELINEYRFIYQDLVFLMSRQRSLARRFRRIIGRKVEAGTAICRLLTADGIMQVSHADEIDTLAQQIAMTATFWLSFAHVRSEKPDPSATARSVAQVLMLVAPHLIDPARDHLLALAREYR